jgi:RNA polymerase sigma factor (sigma-70 family)
MPPKLRTLLLLSADGDQRAHRALRDDWLAPAVEAGVASWRKGLPTGWVRIKARRAALAVNQALDDLLDPAKLAGLERVAEKHGADELWHYAWLEGREKVAYLGYLDFWAAELRVHIEQGVRAVLAPNDVRFLEAVDRAERRLARPDKVRDLQTLTRAHAGNQAAQAGKWSALDLAEKPQHLPRANEEDEDWEPDPRTPTPDEYLAQKEELEILEAVLSELPEEERRMLEWSLEDCPQEECARELEVTRVNYRQMLHRLRRKVWQLYRARSD